MCYWGARVPGPGGACSPLPNPDSDQYDASEIARLKNDYNLIQYPDEFRLNEGDYETGRWRKLTEGVDYTYDKYLGWLSLTGALGPNDALAVTYQYRTTTGETVTVGDFADHSQEGSSNGERSLLKLLRDNAPTATDAPWDLRMRNIYRVGAARSIPTTSPFRSPTSSQGIRRRRHSQGSRSPTGSRSSRRSGSTVPRRAAFPAPTTNSTSVRATPSTLRTAASSSPCASPSGATSKACSVTASTSTARRWGFRFRAATQCRP